jgi:hypothetical protein
MKVPVTVVVLPEFTLLTLTEPPPTEMPLFFVSSNLIDLSSSCVVLLSFSMRIFLLLDSLLGPLDS